MPKERNKADSYREKAYEGDTKAMNNLGVCYEPPPDTSATLLRSA